MTIRQRDTSKSSKKDDKSGSGSKPKARAPPFSGRYNPTFKRSELRSADGTIMSHQTWAKIVTMAAISIVVYFSIKNSKTLETPLAKRSEMLDKIRSSTSMCSPAYRKDILDLGNKACLPNKCGRGVVDGLVSDKELHQLLKLAKKGLGKGGSNGGASIIDLHSGSLSEGDHFVNIYKKHPGVYGPDDFITYREITKRVQSTIADHFGIPGNSLYLTYPTFFSRMDSTPAKTMHDEYWHVHIDKETYPSFHYTSLLYLADFGNDFTGGEFVFVDTTDKLNRTIEPRTGRLSFFTSGIENKHHVKPVTGGVRYALTMGFTCDKSKGIPDPGSPEHFAQVN